MTLIDSDLEREARVLRNILYGPQCDESWNQVKHHWVEDIGWLQAMVRRKAERDRQCPSHSK